MRTLTFITGPLQGTSFELSGTEITLGRSDSNAIPIPDHSVSGHHCAIREEAGVLYITDLNSTNGTCLNGQALLTASALSGGAVILIGSVEARFDEYAEDPSPAAGPETEPQPGAEPELPADVPSSSSEVAVETPAPTEGERPGSMIEAAVTSEIGSTSAHAAEPGKGSEDAIGPAPVPSAPGPAVGGVRTAAAGPSGVQSWRRRLGSMAFMVGRFTGKTVVVVGGILWKVSIILLRLFWKLSVLLGRLVWQSLLVLGRASGTRIKHWKTPGTGPGGAGSELAAVWRGLGRAPDGSPRWLRVYLMVVALGQASAETAVIWWGVLASTAVALKESRQGRVVGRWMAWFMETRLGHAIRYRVRNWIRSMKGLMTEGEIALLDGAREGRTPICLMPTNSRVDVGEWCNPWWGGARVWIAVVGTDVVMIAEGKRPFVERIAIADLPESRYNPVTGELVLAKDVTEVARKIRLPPVEGWQVLGYMIGKGEMLCWK